MAKHGGPCVHFSGISTCGRTSRETVSHPQHPPLPTLCKISLPVYVIATNERLQPLTIIWYNSLVLSFSLLEIYIGLFCAVDGSALSFADGAVNCFTFLLSTSGEAIRDVKQTRRGCRSTTSSSSNTLLTLIHGKARIEVYSQLAGPWKKGIIAHQTPHFRRPPKHANNKGPPVFAQTSSKCTFRTKSFNIIWKYLSFGRYV